MERASVELKDVPNESSVLEVLMNLQMQMGELKKQNQSIIARLNVLEEEKRERDEKDKLEEITEIEEGLEDPQQQKEEEGGGEEEEEDEEKIEANRILLLKKKVEERKKLLRSFRGLTNILKSEEEVKLLEQEIDGNFNPTEWKIIFRASKHRFSSKRFHQKCDNINGTLVIIETTTGNIFGGYNPFLWNQMNGYFHSSGSFIFGIYKESKKICLKRFDYNENGFGIFCSPRHGPIFGGGQDICVSDKCDLIDKNFVDQGYKHSSYPHNGSGRYFLNGGKSRNFMVKEYEVFVKRK